MSADREVIGDYVEGLGQIEEARLIRFGSVEALQDIRKIADRDVRIAIDRELSRKDRPSYCRTYRIVTPESAETGDYAEFGFIISGGNDLQAPEGLVGPDFAKWREENEIDSPVEPKDPEEDTPAWYDGEKLDPFVLGAFNLLHHYSAFEQYNGGNSYTSGTESNYRTGDEREEEVHFSGFSGGQLAQLVALVKRFLTKHRDE